MARHESPEVHCEVYDAHRRFAGYLRGEREVELGNLVLPEVLGLGVDLPQHREVEYAALGLDHALSFTGVVSNHADVGVGLPELP